MLTFIVELPSDLLDSCTSAIGGNSGYCIPRHIKVPRKGPSERQTKNLFEIHLQYSDIPLFYLWIRNEITFSGPSSQIDDTRTSMTPVHRPWSSLHDPEPWTHHASPGISDQRQDRSLQAHHYCYVNRHARDSTTLLPHPRVNSLPLTELALPTENDSFVRLGADSLRTPEKLHRSHAGNIMVWPISIQILDCLAVHQS